MRQPRLCGRCGQPIKRGQDWMEGVGIRFHMDCVRKASEAKRQIDAIMDKNDAYLRSEEDRRE